MHKDYALSYNAVKERLFGRYVLRQEQTPKNVGWIEKLKRNYASWTSEDFFKPYIDAGCQLIEPTETKVSLQEILIIS